MNTGRVHSTLSPVVGGRSLRVGFLNNPLSGGNRRHPGPVQQVLDAHAEVLRHDVKTPADVASALADLAQHKIDVVTINGGDGTVQAVMTAILGDRIFESSPLLAVLSAGTTSMIAGDVGVRGGRVGGLRRLLSWARSPDTDSHLVERSVLRLEHYPGAPPRLGLPIAGDRADPSTHRGAPGSPRTTLR